MKDTIEIFKTRSTRLKILLILFVCSWLLIIVAGAALAANTATQSVTFQVTAINEMAVSDNPAAMKIEP